MKPLFIAIFLMALITSNLLSKTDPKPKYFEIASDTFPIGEDETRSFLWSMYEDHDTKWRDIYHTYKTERWMDNYSKYTNDILDLLKNRGYDRNRLEKIFVQILMENHGQVALLPYAIYHLKTNTENYWIVHCAWEYPSDNIVPGKEIVLDGRVVTRDENKSHSNMEMIHIRMWAFRDSDLKVVGFSTCM